jgi:O-antigen/teichoic acid export membrane protein
MKGGGIFSFVYANAVTALISPVFLLWHCRRLDLLPRAGEWGKISRKVFKEVFNYAWDIFLFSLGAQLQMASQTIVVSRALGLEAAALWSVGTKMFNLAVPLMCRPNGAALPGLYEMLARGERQRLAARFQDVVLLTASLGAFLGVSYALCNHLFVEVWTGGRIVWPAANDVLLGVWLFCLSLQTTHCCFVMVTKQIGAMRYILFMEGCSFIGLSLMFGCRWGIAGMVATSIACTLAFSLQYSLRRSRDFFGCPVSALLIDWVRPSLKLAAVYGFIGLGVSLSSAGLPVFWRLGLHGAVSCMLGGLLFWRLGLPAKMIDDVMPKLPRPVVRLLRFARS